MPYQFPPEVEKLVKKQMTTGNYNSEDELLLDALRTLDQRNEDLAAIQEGIDDMEAGRMRPLEGVADDIRKKHGWSSDT